MCEDTDVEVDCPRCGGRKQFLNRSRRDIISYTFKSRSWTERVLAIAYNAEVFDLQFVLNRLALMKLLSELLIMNGQKIMCLKLQNFKWLDSLNYPAMQLRWSPEAISMTAAKSWYPNLFNRPRT